MSEENEEYESALGSKQGSRRDSQGRQSGASATSSVDTLNTEFIYYSAVLRSYAPGLSRDHDKMTTHLWMRKLFKPEYHSTVLKPKRNKYLLYLTITIYNDETYGIFRQEPPCGVLPEIKDIPFDKNFPPAAWESEKQWSETLSDLPNDIKISECYLHDSGCPQPVNKLNEVLDSEFQFFLWLSRPYVALLQDPEDKTMAACWIQILCGIASEENDCVEMKELRNDYMQALIGFCVGDRFYLCENKILCEYDYEERLVFANMAYNPPSIAAIKRHLPPPVRAPRPSPSTGHLGMNHRNGAAALHPSTPNGDGNARLTNGYPPSSDHQIFDAK